MDEETEDKVSQPPFLEVYCSSSGKTRRFAAGTESGYALYIINKKLDTQAPQAFLIEAFKEGEEPVSFGPNAILISYGKDWKLQTVTEKGFEEAKSMWHDPRRFSSTMVDYADVLPNGFKKLDGPGLSFNFSEWTWVWVLSYPDRIRPIDRLARNMNKKSSGAPSQSGSTNKSRSTISYMYIAKILLAAVFLFLLGGMLTFFLENLPALIELVSSPF